MKQLVTNARGESSFAPSSDPELEPKDLDSRKCSQEEEWGLPAWPDDDLKESKWEDQTPAKRVLRFLRGLWLTSTLLLLLYAFACSLDLLGAAFRLVGARGAGRVFREARLLRDPLVGLAVGVLSAVFLQSSSTATSVVVALVASHMVTVREAVPVVMGTNIGTSVTSTIVALGQATDRDQFRRAFAAATLHDAFNWLAVAVLLPLELITGYLERITELILVNRKWDDDDDSQDFENETTAVRKSDKGASLQTLTKPFTSLIVQLDKGVIEAVASGRANDSSKSFLKTCSSPSTYNGNDTTKESVPQRCGYLLESLGLGDGGAGAFLLVASLVSLCACLLLLVRLLSIVLRGKTASWIRRLLNSDGSASSFHRCLAGWGALIAGAMITALLQSSSVFTSALTPLAGCGAVTLERLYPLVLGANLGTTTTSLLAAWASASRASLHNALRIALCHLLFNVSGILLFYPIPATRLPIPIAKCLGSITSRYRWFALFYLFFAFLLLPGAAFGLSAAGPWAMGSVGCPLALLLIFVLVVNVLQRKRPSLLPIRLRDWGFLPMWAHSLDPWDQLVSRVYDFCACCSRCCGERGDTAAGLLRPTGRHDASALGLLPNPSQINILQPCSASSSALSLASSASTSSFGGSRTPTTQYRVAEGFENVAFGPLRRHSRRSVMDEEDRMSEISQGTDTTAV